MKKSFLYIFMLVALTGTGCSALDTEPHTLVPETFFNTESELNSFLLSVYSPLMQGEFYGGDFLINTCGGDDLGFYARNTPPVCIMCANTNSADNYVYNLWKALYQGINRANMLMENAHRNTAIAKTFRDRAYAEALFLRSYYYFILIQGWGDVPMRLESVKQATGLDLACTNKQTIYDQLILDIEKAIPDLNDFSSNVTPEFISKTAAEGILARIWLFRAGECYRDKQTPDEQFRIHCFEEAKKWAKAVVDSNIHGLVTPYSRVFMDLSEDKYNSTGVLESMWEAAEAGNRTTAECAAGRLGNTIGWGLSDAQIGITDHVEEGGLANPGFAYNFVYATLKLYEMYESEGDTARMDWNIVPYSYVVEQDKATKVKTVTGRKWYYGKMPRDTAGNPLPAPAGYKYTEDTEVASKANKTRSCAKYRREFEQVLPKNKNFTPINSPILRYSDVLLMLSEAENELNGPTQLAVDCINQVRRRAGIFEYEVGGSKDEFRKYIQNERAMELCFEAGLRRFDLIRWGIFTRTLQLMEGYTSRSGWGANYAYAAMYYHVTDAYQYFPIPEKELSLNKELKRQNPGW